MTCGACGFNREQVQANLAFLQDHPSMCVDEMIHGLKESDKPWIKIPSLPGQPFTLYACPVCSTVRYEP